MRLRVHDSNIGSHMLIENAPHSHVARVLSFTGTHELWRGDKHRAMMKATTLGMFHITRFNPFFGWMKNFGYLVNPFFGLNDNLGYLACICVLQTALPNTPETRAWVMIMAYTVMGIGFFPYRPLRLPSVIFVAYTIDTLLPVLVVFGCFFARVFSWPTMYDLHCLLLISVPLTICGCVAATTVVLKYTPDLFIPYLAYPLIQYQDSLLDPLATPIVCISILMFANFTTLPRWTHE